VALAISLRIVLMAQSWPALDSDEGTMGIMGLDIAYRGATPVFFCGQNYMGALEAYHAAPMFYLFGPTGFALHCGLLFIYASSLGVIYFLTSALYRQLTTPGHECRDRLRRVCSQPECFSGWPGCLFGQVYD
jgi:hypothetical protein